MSAPAQYFRWNGGAMVPRHSRLAEQSYTSGATYRLAVVAEREEGRSAEQNNMLWALLGEVAEQVEHAGRRYTPDQWKALFMYACGHPVQFLPTLDGKTHMPYFHSSSRLSRREFGELLDFITEWGDAHGVRWRHEQGLVWEG
jgi:hypothetical protein